jgi:hypothetical protein
MFQIAFIALLTILINLESGRHIECIWYVLTERQTENTEALDFAAILFTQAPYSYADSLASNSTTDSVSFTTTCR